MSLRETHEKDMEQLQNKLEEAEDKIWKMKNTVNRQSSSPSSDKVENEAGATHSNYRKRRPSHGMEESKIDITKMIREQGEGSEWVDPPTIHSNKLSEDHRYSPPSLDQLLSSPVAQNPSVPYQDDLVSLTSAQTDTNSKEILRLSNKVYI